MKWYQIEVKYGFIKTEPPAFIAREYHRSLRESTENETLRSFCFEHFHDKFQSYFILRTQCIVVIVRDFLWNPSSLMIVLPCQSVKQSLSHSSSRALTDVTLACENHATSPKVTQPLLALGYRILPSQIKPVAEVWSIFLRQSFVKILKPILAMLGFQKRLVYLPFPNLPDIPSLRICINFHYVGKKCVLYSFSFFLWLSFRKADWPDLPSLYCLQYSPVSGSPGQQNTKLPAWQSEKHEILDKNYAQPSSHERFQYLHKGCCQQQWLMKKTVSRCAGCMPIVRNTCSKEHWTQK